MAGIRPAGTAEIVGQSGRRRCTSIAWERPLPFASDPAAADGPAAGGLRRRTRSPTPDGRRGCAAMAELPADVDRAAARGLARYRSGDVEVSCRWWDPKQPPREATSGLPGLCEAGSATAGREPGRPADG